MRETLGILQRMYQEAVHLLWCSECFNLWVHYTLLELVSTITSKLFESNQIKRKKIRSVCLYIKKWYCSYKYV